MYTCVAVCLTSGGVGLKSMYGGWVGVLWWVCLMVGWVGVSGGVVTSGAYMGVLWGCWGAVCMCVLGGVSCVGMGCLVGEGLCVCVWGGGF